MMGSVRGHVLHDQVTHSMILKGRPLQVNPADLFGP